MKNQNPAPTARNTEVRDQTQLAANREEGDAAVRASAIRQMSASTEPALSRATSLSPPTKAGTPDLHPGEITVDAARSNAGVGATYSIPSSESLITAADVADIAVRLIDEAARVEDDDEPLTADDHLVRAGIMTGISSMAMEIQATLTAKRKAGSHE